MSCVHAQVSGSLQPQPSLPRGFTGAHCQVHLSPNASSALAAAYSDSPSKRHRPPPLNQRAIFEVRMPHTAGPVSSAHATATTLALWPRHALPHRSLFPAYVMPHPGPLHLLSLVVWQATRDAILADAEDYVGQFSPLSPGCPNSTRRLQELFGLFQGDGGLERTNTEGPDELLSQVWALQKSFVKCPGCTRKL